VLVVRVSGEQAPGYGWLLLGDPVGAQLAARDREHSISGGVAGRAAAVQGYYRQIPEAVELRLHDPAVQLGLPVR
jgi:hypothetical protein